MFAENYSAFLADFGEEVLVAGQPVRGIFDEAYADPLGVASASPALSTFTSLLPAITVGLSTLVRGVVTYRIANRQDDGTGGTLLILEKQ